MRTGVAIEDMEALIVYLSSGLGFVLLALGVAHFFNMFVIYTFRKSYMAKQQITNDLAALK
jgi:hypothetical protein